MTKSAGWCCGLLAVAMSVMACGESGDDPIRPPVLGDSSGGVAVTGPASLAPVAVDVAIEPLTFTASGEGPFQWTVSEGALPPGVSLSADTGVYSGTPTEPGTFAFRVTATSERGSGSRAFSQVVTGPAPDATALYSGNRIAAFSTAYPAAGESPRAVQGVADGDVLVSLDRRPQNGVLYALGYNATAGTVTLYAVDVNAAVATAVGASGSFVGNDGTTPVRVGVDGDTRFGIDFNPTVDRLRVVNTAGQNFRMNPNTGAFVDANAGPAGNQMDGAISGAATVAQETAYTNSRAGVAVTTQYSVGATAGLCLQNPPNNGTLTGCLTFAPAVDAVMGFDIPPTVTVASANIPATGSAWAVLRMTGQTVSVFARIDLATGAVSDAVELGDEEVLGFALQQPTGTSAIALAVSGTQMVRFRSDDLNESANVTITGVTAGETLVGIDYRPATGQLIGLGIDAADDTGTLYVIDPQGGAASAIGTPSQIAFVTGDGSPVELPDPATVGYGFDFNPTVDRVRVVTSTGLNFRLNPVTGASVDGNATSAGNQMDAALNGVENAGASAAAYTDGAGAMSTTLYVIDSATDQLFIQNPANDGTLLGAQALTLGGSPLDVTAVSGFDIAWSTRVASTGAASTGKGMAAFTVAGTTGLYEVDLSTGGVALLGALPGGFALSGLAIGQTSAR